MWYTMECYSSLKKNEITFFGGTCMEFEDITLSIVSQVQKDKGHMFSPLCG
jgi:hypothetical protein